MTIESNLESNRSEELDNLLTQLKPRYLLILMKLILNHPIINQNPWVLSMNQNFKATIY